MSRFDLGAGPSDVIQCVASTPVVGFRFVSDCGSPSLSSCGVVSGSVRTDMMEKKRSSSVGSTDSSVCCY